MKRQLNYWAKPNKAPETELVNVSLSIEDNNFTVRFGYPGSIQPITQIVFVVDDQKSFDLRKAFELSGAAVFQDEMDERVYFSNIARRIEDAKRLESLSVTIGCSIIVYIICMMVGAFLFNMHIILTLFFSLAVAISFINLIKRKFYK